MNVGILSEGKQLEGHEMTGNHWHGRRAGLTP
jgi:hypothetical protein